MVHSHSKFDPDSWLFSRTGLVTVGVVAILGFLVYTGHSAHLLGFAPFLLLLRVRSCTYSCTAAIAVID